MPETPSPPVKYCSLCGQPATEVERDEEQPRTLFHVDCMRCGVDFTVELEAPYEPPYDAVHLETGLRLLWTLGHYDGPTSGIGLWNGQPMLWQTQEPQQHPRVYWVFPLTVDEFLIEVERHDDFVAYVGRHTCLDAQGRRRGRAYVDGARRDKFYTKYAGLKPRDYRDRDAVGWFTWNDLTGRRDESVRDR